MIALARPFRPLAGRRLLRPAAALLLVAGLAACSRSGPAPVIYGGGESPVLAPVPPPKPPAPRASASPARPAPARTGAAPSRTTSGAAPAAPPAVRSEDPADGAGVVTVQAGDTVYAISRRYKVPVRAIIDRNRLAPPYRLRVGQRLMVPTPRYHVVRAGDTVYGISRRYGIDATTLVRVNRIPPPYRIALGQRLVVSTAAQPRSTETLARTAPTTGPRPGATTAKPAPTRPSAKSVRTARAAPALPPALPPRAGGRFAWPLKGPIISRYGPKPGGLHNDGINIAVPRGAPVRAAENGVVAYAGNELRGFGNLVLVRHAGGWTTAYAHNDELLVRRGDRVRKGQVLARAGATGGVDRSQLHFEIRKGANAVNPLKYLWAPAGKGGTS